MRLRAMRNPRYQNGFQLTIHHDLVALPLRWRKPSMIYVNSMSDLFHEQVPFTFIQEVFQTMVKAQWHTFQILTKRAKRLSRLADKLPQAPNICARASLFSNI